MAGYSLHCDHRGVIMMMSLKFSCWENNDKVYKVCLRINARFIVFLKMRRYLWLRDRVICKRKVHFMSFSNVWLCLSVTDIFLSWKCYSFKLIIIVVIIRYAYDSVIVTSCQSLFWWLRYWDCDWVNICKCANIQRMLACNHHYNLMMSLWCTYCIVMPYHYYYHRNIKIFNDNYH